MSSSSTSGNSGIYVRRAYGYIGAKDYGYIRYGQTDGAFSLLEDGVIVAFGDGAQFRSTDGNPLYVVPSAAQPGQFIYAGQGALYTTDKVVLISPSFTEPYLGGKFSAIASYEPNSNGIKEGYAGCATAGATCAALSSTNAFTSTLAKERQNTFDVAGQYALKLDGFDSKASIGFIDGAPVRYTGSISGANAAYNLDRLEVTAIGAQTSFLGATIGANIKYGQTLDGYALKPKGTRDAFAYIIGGNYVVGPYVIGASFFDSQSAGNQYAGKKNEARTLSEYGTAVGANYVVGKDMSLYVQYLYAHSHQPGNSNLNNGNSQMQMVSLGSTLKW